MLITRLRVLLFRYFTRLQRALSRRLTTPGSLVAGGTLAGLAFGLDIRQTVALQLASMLLALLIVSAAFLLRRRPALRARRTLPPVAAVGTPLSYTLTIENTASRGPTLDVELVDQLDSPLPDAAAMHRVPEPAGIDSLLERLIGLRRWLRLTRARRGANAGAPIFVRLPAAASATTTMTLTPLRRGYVHFSSVTVKRADPMGLVNAVIDIPCPGSLLVLPRRFRVPALRLAGTRRYQMGGAQQASQVGDSREFLSLRDYVSGDPRRHIHWRGWAHTGRPIVKQFEDQYLSRQALILDTATTDSGTRTVAWPGLGGAAFEAAVSLAASFVAAPRPADSVIDLMFIGTQAVHAQSGRSLGAPLHLLELLACAEPNSADLDALTRLVDLHAGQISAAIVILLAWDPPRQRLIQRLREAGVPTAVVVIDASTGPPHELGPMSDQPQAFCIVDPEHIERDIARLAAPATGARLRHRA